MRKPIHVPPPKDFVSYSPSELFRFFFQLGHWTDDSFSGDLQAFTRGKLVSTVTISKWKNRDVIPTRYSGPFLNLIDSMMETNLAKDWTTAFETVWALHSSGRKQNGSLSGNSATSDTVCSQHQKWITQFYEQKCAGEIFSASDIYVPLQLYDVNHDSPQPLDVEDIVTALKETDDKPSGSDWTFISGGPGSGKSMTALHLAQSLCEEDTFPIYIRGSQISDIDIDITDPDQLIVDSFSISSFLKYFRASSYDSTCLILDGIDSIDQNNQGGVDRLNRLLSNLQIEQAVCRAHQKSLRIIAVGRDSHIRFAETKLSRADYKHLSILPLDGCLSVQSGQSRIHGTDIRPIWWEKYLAATNRVNDPSLPDFLSTEYDNFSEFGTEPLLAYLICQTALKEGADNQSKELPHERVNTLTYSANKNKIYETILDRHALNGKDSLDTQRLLSVLQHIAIAIWHTPKGQNVSVKQAYASIQDKGTKTSFRSLNLTDVSTLSPPDTLITAFYYRLALSEQISAQTAIEFTHKSFADYFVSTVIFDRFSRLVSTLDKGNEFETALKDWVDLSRQGDHAASLAGFCQREAALRFEALSNLKWDSALTIIKSHLHSSHFKGTGLNAFVEWQRSSSLLFFTWSCLNLERQKRIGSHFYLSDKSEPFSTGDLKSIQNTNVLDFNVGSLMEPLLRHQTFLTPSLSALNLASADMSQLSFSLGHLERPIFEKSSFAMTHWSHVKISKGNFKGSVFQQVIFHQLQMLGSHLANCFFQGSKFQGAVFSDCHLTDTYFSQCHFSELEFNESRFENVVFDRCVFTQSTFAKDLETDAARSVKFRHCTFIDMEAVLKNIPAESVDNPILQDTDQPEQTSPHDPGLKGRLGKLL